MKKISLIILAFMLSILAISCNNNTDDDDNDDGGDNVSKLIKYEDMYNGFKTTKYPEIAADGRHFASTGYTQNDVQGYNDWYYLASDEELVFEPTKQLWFLDEDTYMKDADINIGTENTLVRKFVSTFTGYAKVYGTLKHIVGSNNEATFRVKLNGETIFNDMVLTLENKDGIYHESDTYLVEGDVITFEVTGSDVKVSWNPCVDFTMSADTLHTILPTGAYFGDVHPFYDEATKQMYMYYLDTNGTFTSRLAVSNNMIRYSPMELFTHPTNPPKQDNYFVLGIYKDGDVYRSYFGLGGSFGSSVSQDLLTWESGSMLNSSFKIEREAFFDYENFPDGGRDPYGFYDYDINRARVIGMAYKNRNTNRSLVLYTSSDEEGKYFDDKPVELINYPIGGDPECPMMAKIGNRWYIFTSIYGRTAHGVGPMTYYIGDEDTPIHEVDWKNKKENLLTSEDLSAAQLVNVGGRFYVYGWMPQVWNSNNWGGILNIPREVIQNEDGTLGTKLDPYFYSLLNKGVDHRYDGFGSGDGIVKEDDIYTSSKVDSTYSFNGEFGRSLMNTKMTLQDGIQGLTLHQGSNTYEVLINKTSTKTTISIGQLGQGHNPSSKMEINESLDEIDLKLVLEGGCAVLSVNDFYTIESRTSIDLSSNFTVKLLGTTGTIFDGFKIYRLATSMNIYE